MLAMDSDLLNLPSNSPDAKMFREYANKTAASSTVPIASGITNFLLLAA